MKKDFNYYMNLPYEISIKKVPEEMGGGHIASIPLLGEHRCRGYGKTIKQALNKLEEVKEDLFQDYLKKDYDILEPIKEEEQYSGKLILRIPKILHRILAQAAKENDISLNQYLVHLLSLNFGARQFTKLSKRIESISKHIFEMRGSQRKTFPKQIKLETISEKKDYGRAA